MKYVKLEIMCPEGYEQLVKEAALRKIDSIISQLTLAPNEIKKTEYDIKSKEVRSLNKIIIK